MSKIFCYSVFIICVLFTAFSFAEEAKAPPAHETIINHYREIIRNTTDPARLADAHYEIGLALEKLGRESEATAEYLKIVINYPEVKELSEKAEERLAHLYTGFSVKSKEPSYKPTPGEKDPAIFFAYIRGLYENYRNLGQYDKALQILQKLYDLDSENETYLVDIGNIYLHGHNDPKQAIFHFKKAIEANPANVKAYIDLGKAYEKQGDYEAVLSTYTDLAEKFPANPWTMYGLKRTEGIRLAKDKKLVKDWFIIGPFDNRDKDGLKKHFPPEDNIDLNATYRGKSNASLRWARPFDYGDSGYVDLNTLVNPNDYGIAYAVTYVYSPVQRKVDLRFGSDGGIRVWVDDTEVAERDIERFAEADDDVIKATLNKGWNRILLKISETWGSWGFYFRITDTKGNAIQNLIFDPLKDESRSRKLSGIMKKKKRLKITGIALVYTGALSIFLVGIIFMISNIQNRIKINRMKEDFISSVSHELKTPIAAIKMFAETLKRGKVKEDGRRLEYSDMIIRESDRLTRFIEKILDFSKLEKGGRIFEFKEENLVLLAKSAADIYAKEIGDEGLKIRVNAKKDTVTANIDRDALMQAVLNLVENAHKYSEIKEITINVGEAPGRAYLEVVDKGEGIPKNELGRIFDKFYRVEEGKGSSAKGSGLGLAFTKSVVAAHKGNIKVESKPGKGSKFTIWLPVQGGMRA